MRSPPRRKFCKFIANDLFFQLKIVFFAYIGEFSLRSTSTKSVIILFLLCWSFVAPVEASDLSINSHVYTVKELEVDFPQATIRTISTWTGDRIHEYRGPRLADVIARAGIGENMDVFAKAADGYSVEILRSDIDKFNPIIATRQDGAPIPFSKKGPLRLIWPRSDFEDLTILQDGYWIWFLTDLESLM